MMKKTMTLVVALLTGLATTTMAETPESKETQDTKKKATIELPAWMRNIKISGFAMLQYQGQDKEGAHENSFNLRLARVSIDGNYTKFAFKLQFQANGNTSTLGASPRLVDLWAEWQPLKAINVKAGQFKRPFTFENPMNPINQGFMNYGQVVTKLAGFNDRTGEHASNGRDIGIQIQGDLFPNANGRPILHYQAGVFNGEGINRKDANNKKDLIGGLWVMPVKGMRIGVFGWTGYRDITYTYNVDYLQHADMHPVLYLSAPATMEVVKTVKKNRYALSFEYAFDDWTIRSEYIHSQGYGANEAAGDKADGFYALCIAPIIKNKLHVKARYDLYRDRKEWSSSKTFYEIGADYMFNKNIQLNVEYARVNDRTLASPNYNLVDVELDFRF